MTIAGENFDQWFEGKRFTTDWSTRAFPTWNAHLSNLRNEQLRILEIGSWEGRGSLFFLNYFTKSHLTCIDLFTLGNDDLFNSNVASVYGNRVTKIAGRSTIELEKLSMVNAKFDLIYIDGSHDRDDVIIDTILAWRLLEVGGIVIWDDYDLVAMATDAMTSEQDPKPSIDTFLEWHKDELEIIHAGYQMISRKTKPHFKGSVVPVEQPVIAQKKKRGLLSRVINHLHI